MPKRFDWRKAPPLRDGTRRVARCQLITENRQCTRAADHEGSCAIKPDTGTVGVPGPVWILVKP